MKIFLSWSGITSQKIAEVFRGWLPSVIQAVRPYFSPDDTNKGARWNPEMTRNLYDAKVGIICLTKENISAPWIMFEAGALSSSLEKSRVVPILFGIESTDVSGPLVQFQSAHFEKEEIAKVVKTINAELKENALPLDTLQSVFEMWWPQLLERVELIFKENQMAAEGDLRSDRDLLEEVLELARGQSERPKHFDHNTVVLSQLVDAYGAVVRRARAGGYLENLADVLDELGRPIVNLVNGQPSDVRLARSLLDRFYVTRKVLVEEEDDIPF